MAKAERAAAVIAFTAKTVVPTRSLVEKLALVEKASEPTKKPLGTDLIPRGFD
jgi:hypothetical protein